MKSNFKHGSIKMYQTIKARSSSATSQKDSRPQSALFSPTVRNPPQAGKHGTYLSKFLTKRKQASSKQPGIAVHYRSNSTN